MENKIITTTKDFEYSVIELPREAENIEKELKDNGELVLTYWQPVLWSLDAKEISIPSNSELIGSLEDLTEDQAREILGDFSIRQTSSGETFTEALSYLKSLVESKGINSELKKIIVLKTKI